MVKALNLIDWFGQGASERAASPLATAKSREQGSATPISGLAAQLMRLHGAQGYLEKDPATLFHLYREHPSED